MYTLIDIESINNQSLRNHLKILNDRLNILSTPSSNKEEREQKLINQRKITEHFQFMVSMYSYMLENDFCENSKIIDSFSLKWDRMKNVDKVNFLKEKANFLKKSNKKMSQELVKLLQKSSGIYSISSTTAHFFSSHEIMQRKLKAYAESEQSIKETVTQMSNSIILLTLIIDGKKLKEIKGEENKNGYRSNFIKNSSVILY